jgi:Zn-dependent protease
MSEIFIFLPVLLFSVIIHEIAHGWMALRCGDDTALRTGRLTLNPVPHIDPFMTILLPLLLIVSRAGFIIGGAKPVPINPYLLRNGEKDNLKVTFAGPASNLLLAAGAILLLVAANQAYRLAPSRLLDSLRGVLMIMIWLNLILANFNLIPIPPLDGSHILAYFLRGEARSAYARLQNAGMIPLFALLFLGNMIRIGGMGLFSWLFMPSHLTMDLVQRFLLG